MSRIYVVGLTGGIATGKSTVSRMLKDLGAHIIDADLLSREVVSLGSEGARRIRETFGDGVFKPSGELDRERLASIVFGDDAARDKLNRIIHPLVMDEIHRSLQNLRRWDFGPSAREIAVVDAPLLYEVGADSLCDEVWVVSVPRDQQISRLMKRGGYTWAEVVSRIRSQMPLEEKERLAQAVVDNRGSIEDTEIAVRGLWKNLRNRVQ